jgi:hypothetical protein
MGSSLGWLRILVVAQWVLVAAGAAAEVVVRGHIPGLTLWMCGRGPLVAFASALALHMLHCAERSDR